MGRKTICICFALLGIALIAAGCGNAQKETTEAAIHAAQAAINAVQTDAAKYVPDQLQSAEKALQNANDALAKSDYAEALSAAQDAASKAKDLATAAAVKRAEWTRQWTDLSASIPKSLDDVRNKLDAYSHGAPMPAGVDKAKLADAKKQYEQMKQTWSAATAAATQGNLGESMKKMAGIKDALAKLMEILGIKT
jgi:DNA repair exonuclease SbcCD ATPase subunit